MVLPMKKLRAAAVVNKGNDNTVRPDEGQSSGKDALSGETFHASGQGHAFELVGIVMGFAKHAEK